MLSRLLIMRSFCISEPSYIFCNQWSRSSDKPRHSCAEVECSTSMKSAPSFSLVAFASSGAPCESIHSFALWIMSEASASPFRPCLRRTFGRSVEAFCIVRLLYHLCRESFTTKTIFIFLWIIMKFPDALELISCISEIFFTVSCQYLPVYATEILHKLVKFFTWNKASLKPKMFESGCCLQTSQ